LFDPGPEMQDWPEPVYPSLEAWVSDWFAPVFARYLGASAHWCSRWWDHAEAIIRLEELWRSWEVLHKDPALGMSSWLKDHLDPQRSVLMSDSGPFHACHAQEGRHNRPPELAVTGAPAGWWDMSRQERRPG